MVFAAAFGDNTFGVVKYYYYIIIITRVWTVIYGTKCVRYRRTKKSARGGGGDTFYSIILKYMTTRSRGYRTLFLYETVHAGEPP